MCYHLTHKYHVQDRFQTHVPLRNLILQVSHEYENICRGAGNSVLGREAFLRRSDLGGCRRGGQREENGQKHPWVHLHCDRRSKGSSCHAWDNRHCGMNVPLAPKFVKRRTEAWCSKGCDLKAAGKEFHMYRTTVRKGDITVLQTLMVHLVVYMVSSQFPSPEVCSCMSFLSALKKKKKASF